MPSDLFGDVAHPASPAPTRGRTVVVISIGLHAIVITGALFLSLSSPGLLPVPREALAYIDRGPEVKMADIELVPSRPVSTAANPATAVETTAASVTPDAAPVVAPIGVAPGDDSARVNVLRPVELSGIEGGKPGLSNDLAVGHLERLAAPVPATPQAPVRLHSGIREPTKTLHVDPAYPPLAQSARVQGVVILEAVVGASGRVESVEILKSIPLLDAAAIAAVRQWLYRPALLNDKPIPVIITVTVNFKL